jgi:hypothetical protein
MRDESSSIGAVAFAEDHAASVFAAASNTEVLAAAPRAGEGSGQMPVNNEAVMQILANDISIPTRGRNWRIYSRI